MHSRQQKLLKNIIEEHINSACPVGSRFLVDKYRMNVSSATIRNDMAWLERQGMITHPHTSAGRVPTEKGYRYYLENYLDKTKLISKKDKLYLEKRLKEASGEKGLKNVAKEIANLAGAAVFLAFDKNDVFYTGIANLFSQPEFSNLPFIYNMSNVIDHLDEVISSIYDQVDETEIKIGSENYFDRTCAAILTKSGKKIFGILGPMRMDYERNLTLVNYAREIIDY